MNRKKHDKKTVWEVNHPDRILSYFMREIRPLTVVTASGILYNIGMVAGPYFEGQLAQRLYDIIQGSKTIVDMVELVLVYLSVILFVQVFRCVKRFYVRRFANNASRNMRHMLYNSLVHKSKAQLETESVGVMMTKAVIDVDACVEGMRKFTTEIFDTGVVLVAYLVMLFVYDWRLALISCIFTPFAYLIAGRLKAIVTRRNYEYKKCAGKLNDTTLDRVSNAILYRVYGRENSRDEAYEMKLKDYEKKAVAANIWENMMQPIYNTISMCGVVFIIYQGSRNIMGTGWITWNIAAFTTFLSCFAKMALKSSKAAKLFNSVQKAQVSWKRIKPLMEPYIRADMVTDINLGELRNLTVTQMSFAYSAGKPIIRNLSFSAQPGEIIGVTGPVASGKSTFGKIFLKEHPYEGSIQIGDLELSQLTEYERSRLISYMGHEPELMSDSLKENICLGEEKDITKWIQMVSLEQEVAQLQKQEDTYIGNGGVCLSGGQQARVALARALSHGGCVMILDDPFSALDRNTEKEIMRNLRTIAENKIIILISHRLYMFPEFNRIIWIGRQETKIGTHGQLMKVNQEYAQLYHKQMAGGDLDEQKKG